MLQSNGWFSNGIIPISAVLHNTRTTLIYTFLFNNKNPSTAWLHKFEYLFCTKRTLYNDVRKSSCTIKLIFFKCHFMQDVLTWHLFRDVLLLWSSTNKWLFVAMAARRRVIERTLKRCLKAINSPRVAQNKESKSKHSCFLSIFSK